VLMHLILLSLQLFKDFVKHSQAYLSCVIFASVLTLIMDIVVREQFLFVLLLVDNDDAHNTTCDFTML